MPVWPTCFWICWPIPRPPPPMRFPAAMTPMSRIRTPASARASSVASAARSTVSLSGCFPNFVILMPRIQTPSLLGTGCSLVRDGFEAEADGPGTGAVGAERVRRQPDLHAQRDVLGIGLDVDDVGPHAGALAVDDGGHERDRNAGSGVGDDRERPDFAARGDRHPAEVGAA